MTTIYEKPNKTLAPCIQILPTMKPAKKKWILIEDSAEKAKYILANVLRLHPIDELIWLYPENENPLPPTYIKEIDGKGAACFEGEIKLPNLEQKVITGKLRFHWCRTRQEFFDAFNAINDHNGIILLDVQLTTLGKKHYLDEQLAGKIQYFLEGGPKDAQSLITIISGIAAHGRTRDDIAPEDERVLTIGGGRWSFSSRSNPKDSVEAIEESQENWDNLYGNPTLSISDFLEKMAEFDQHECHNWRDEIPSELIKYKSRGRWNDNWKMPKQLGYLIQLLKYDPDKFVKEFNLKTKKGFFRDGCDICECMKVMGTKAKADDPESKGTESFSLLGTLFVCWAAYRNVFVNKASRQDALFIEAIKSCNSKNIARNSKITPPQTNETLKKTIIALYDMMSVLYKSTIKKGKGKDLLKRIKLDKGGLNITLEIDPQGLFDGIKSAYEKRIFQFEVEGGGTSSNKILNFYQQTNFCDELQMDKKPFLGSYYGFKVMAAGKNPQNGINITFGNG
ncbi:MAG: hypothetical protein DHS20C18_00250 [Saprospiraceae bacterium]|nr:MAG: hypothetical protein DHS20C18_00250 [Saprospiraceae bacterium]